VKSLYQRYLRAEPSRCLRATSVSPFAFSSINRHIIIYRIDKGFEAVSALIDYGLQTNRYSFWYSKTTPIYLMKIESEINKLIQSVVNGETQISVELSERLINDGLTIERLTHEGLTAALRSLDAKCTNEEFNLLEIMLAGKGYKSP
jgi:hypothetical protein